MEWLPRAAAAAALLLQLAGLLSAGHAVLHARLPQGSIAWALSLVFLAPVAVPLYWLFGRWKYERYVVSRREGRGPIHELRDRLHEENEAVEDEGGPRSELWRELEALSGLRPTRGNRLRLLIDAEQTFEDLFAGIEAAERQVLVQFYALDGGELGGGLLQRLEEKARQGVAVRLLFDRLGSWELDEAELEPLRRAGGQAVAFEAKGRWTGRLQLNFRNHRKVAVIDGRRAWVGGLNATQVCLGRDPRLKTWRDTHLALEGPAARALQLGFLEDWSWATGELPEPEWPEPAAEPGGAGVAVLPTGPADEVDSLALAFSAAFGAARRRLWISTPYFLPDERVTSALQLAALRGVDVRLLLPSVSDHRIVHLASLAQHAEVATAGVRLFRYSPGFLHQKVALIDDDLCLIGSGNLDNRSLRLNFETTVAVRDEGLAADLERALVRDFEQSEEQPADALARRSLATRVSARVARLFAPVL